MPTPQKHLISCRCILPQYKKSNPGKNHQFVVFSVVEDDQTIKPKYAQCNNCGLVHKVIDICKSEIIAGKEESHAIVTKDDIKLSMNQTLATILEKYNVDISDWEYAQYVHEHKLWGNFLVLTQENDENYKRGKYLVILGENLFKVEPYERSELIK